MVTTGGDVRIRGALEPHGAAGAFRLLVVDSRGRYRVPAGKLGKQAVPDFAAAAAAARFVLDAGRYDAAVIHAPDGSRYVVKRVSARDGLPRDGKRHADPSAV